MPSRANSTSFCIHNHITWAPLHAPGVAYIYTTRARLELGDLHNCTHTLPLTLGSYTLNTVGRGENAPGGAHTIPTTQLDRYWVLRIGILVEEN